MADRRHVKWDVRSSGKNVHVTRTEVSTSTQVGRRTETRKTSQKTQVQ